MKLQEVAAHDVVSFADLKSLAAAAGPCITMVTLIPNPVELPVRLKNAIRAVQKELADRGAGASSSSSLLGPIEEVAATAEIAQVWANALIAFRSPDLFRYYWLRGPVNEAVAVAERFQIRPLLSAVRREQRFHLLALSQRHIRLFECTQHRAEEVNLRGVAPQSLREWANTDQPDHLLQNRISGGPSVGSMKGVAFGTGTDREREDEYLRHFLKEVDRGVRGLMRDDAVPLVLAGVEYEVAIYRRVNTWPRLLDEAVAGSPDGLTPPELHQRAWELVARSISEPLRKALADFQKQSDAGRVSSNAREIVKAAFEGRVADLFFSESAEERAAWDETAHEVRDSAPAGRRDEDLLNAAALQTILHGGRAFELGPPDMPAGHAVAAVLRF